MATFVNDAKDFTTSDEDSILLEKKDKVDFISHWKKRLHEAIDPKPEEFMSDEEKEVMRYARLL